MKVRIALELDVDPEDYLPPADGNIKIDIRDSIVEFLNDISGVEVILAKHT
jgi:hypothetical protein